MSKLENECPLWNVCNDQWKYYSNKLCPMAELIAKGEVSERAVRLIKREISTFLEDPLK